MSRAALWRTAAAVLYAVMAVWLIAAGARRLMLASEGVSQPDFAAVTSLSLGLCALLVGAVAAVATVRSRRRIAAGART